MTTSMRTRGFTLIELLVVIAIIAILSGIVFANTSTSRGKGRDAQRVSDMGQLQLSLQLYFDRCGQYPSSLSTSANNGCPSGVTLGTYIATVPTPPTGAGQTSYDYATLTVSGAVVNYVIHGVLEQYNAAVAKGLTAMPAAGSGSWSATYTCSTGSTPPINYCVSSNY